MRSDETSDRHLESIRKPDAAGPTIDWSRFGTDGTDVPGNGSGDGTDHQGPDESDLSLLHPEGLDRLDPAREGVSVSTLHPDRLAGPSLDETRRIAEAVATDGRVETWVRSVNPTFAADARSGRASHTENCADCARSVQATLDGHPTAAAAISPEGLPLAGSAEEGGEHSAYTEQWAGRQAETTDYRDIGRRLEVDHGSAIVFASGDGGHAFNALWSPDRGRVLWADGQTGEVGDWPPAHLEALMPSTRAIFFPAARRHS